MLAGRHRFVLILFGALLCGALLLPAASARTPAPKSARTNAPSGKPAPVLNDEALERAITRRFANSAIASNGFSVSVSGGIATLRGVARVAQHKGVATRLARAAGAKQVRNQIVLSPAARETMQRLRQKQEVRAKPSGGHSGKAAPLSRAQGSGNGMSSAIPGGSQRSAQQIIPPRPPRNAVTESSGVASIRQTASAPKRFALLPAPREDRSMAWKLRQERLRRY